MQMQRQSMVIKTVLGLVIAIKLFIITLIATTWMLHNNSEIPFITLQLGGVIVCFSMLMSQRPGFGLKGMRGFGVVVIIVSLLLLYLTAQA